MVVGAELKQDICDVVEGYENETRVWEEEACEVEKEKRKMKDVIEKLWKD